MHKAHDIVLSATVAGTETEKSPNHISGVLSHLIILLGLMVVLYSSVLFRLGAQWWDDPNFSHGAFVPLFSAFLVWRKREQLACTRVAPSWRGLPVLIGGLSLLTIGVYGADLFMSRISLLLVLAGIMIYCAGWSFFRAVLFPWALLILMIPLPAIVFNQLTFPLQLLASKLASELLPLCNVPVLREGNVINLPSMPLEVAEACSGIRSLMSLTTMAVIYGTLTDNSVLRRITLALAAIPIAVAANAFRIFGTGLLVQYWDPDKALGFFHEFSGWVIFVFSLLLLLSFHKLLLAFSSKATRTAALEPTA
jgi:exosortase